MRYSFWHPHLGGGSGAPETWACRGIGPKAPAQAPPGITDVMETLHWLAHQVDTYLFRCTGNFSVVVTCLLYFVEPPTRQKQTEMFAQGWHLLSLRAWVVPALPPLRSQWHHLPHRHTF